MGTQQGEDSHLSADPTLRLFAISSDHLFSTKALSHGLLSFCALRRTQPAGLKLTIHTFQSSIFSILLKLVSCSPLSGCPEHPGCLERPRSPTETWTGCAAPRRGLLPLTPVPIKSRPIFRCLFQPAERAWHLDNLGHTLCRYEEP